MPVKQLQGMPTIQSAVGILLGTFALIGEKMEENTRNVNIKIPHVKIPKCTTDM